MTTEKVSLPNERYVAMDGPHCAYVFDTARPILIDGKQAVYRLGPRFDTVCECAVLEDAEQIATALNRVYRDGLLMQEPP